MKTMRGGVAAATAIIDFFSQKVRPCYYATTESERDRDQMQRGEERLSDCVGGRASERVSEREIVRER